MCWKGFQRGQRGQIFIGVVMLSESCAVEFGSVGRE